MPVPKEFIYEGEFTIRTSEIDRAKKVTATAFIDLMQEAAMQNVIELKVSVWDMAEKNISWVLMRKNLKLYRLPSLGETIKIQTYPAGFDKLFTYRDYKVFDQNNTLLAESSSTWLLMNTIRRSIARIPEEIRVRGDFDTSKCLPHAKNKLPKLTRVDLQKTFIVNWHDMDFNEHLNNVRYMQWMFETVDYYLKHTGKLEELDIIYKAECYWKDTVEVSTQKVDETVYLHRLVRLSDGEEIALAKTTWSQIL
ncbi:acyl-ACP thioesterase domain-containing protein [Aureispira sp. CCB-E]|uniref:acyl-[acyl-carrier-protein] thioesterase n=1 Tax=Aureispira sp. CCB-E TaxID=3051121 RepID=UPI002869066A|nr:acyl-ACP thioesterase domain-containing protein [Aureispira sp. CCB-E]WMX12074.1 thioesterase [Aureispira sp. CCB-E]